MSADVEAQRWLAQAELDLAAARDNCPTGHYEWACFCSQQAGEKALKAVVYRLGRTSVVTHSLLQLVTELEALGVTLGDIRAVAKHLDQHYIPTRYPNGLASPMIPGRFYGREDAERCTQFADLILTACRSFLATFTSSSSG